MTDGPDGPRDELLPPAVNTLLGLSWIVLFAGRWIVVQLLLAAGALSPSMVSDLDDRVLARCYLALLALSIMVLALRTMRQRRPPHPGGRPAPDEATAAPVHPQPVSSIVTDRRPDSRD